MNIDPTSEKPIFLQIADEIEDAVFTGVFKEETQIPSTNEVASLWKINPHTVLKGMNILVDQDIIYKKRGLGMFVKQGAVKKITQKRQNNFYDVYIESLVEEAKKLDITFEEVMKLIERGYENGSN